MRERKTALACLATVLLATGCSQTRSYQPPVDPNTLDETQYIHYLARVPVVTFEEGCRAMVILMEGQDRFANQDERESYLRSAGAVRESWKIAPEQNLDTGTLAYMLAAACDLPPTAGTVLLGSWGLGDRRYALRQVVDEGLLTFAPDYKPVAGGDLVMALAHAEDYLARTGKTEQEPMIESPADL